MQFFDVHMHLPAPDRAGLDAFLSHVEREKGMLGGLLILNTEKEVDFMIGRAGELPETVAMVPYYEAGKRHDAVVDRTGWYKIHPTLQRIDTAAVGELCAETQRHPKPRGLIVHCYPWGKDLAYNSSLPLVLGLAAALPDVPILATHGGGYESWAFRAHAALYKNVVFDFSVTLSYYLRSDILRPLQRYLRYSPERVVFGSDWPTAECGEQLAEMARLAEEAGIGMATVERCMLENSARLWPGLVPQFNSGEGTT